MLHHCGINAWLQNSVVLHAVSPTATGAYRPRQVVAPVFSHEPIAVTAPTGETVLFYTTTVQLHRTPTVCKTCTDCSGGNSSMDCPPDWDAKGRDWSVPLPTYMTWTNSSTMDEGWSKPVLLPSSALGIDPSVDTNFAPVIMANGSLVGVTRTASIVFAEDWRRPETYRCVAHPNATTDVPDFGEDPNIWQGNRSARCSTAWPYSDADAYRCERRLPHSDVTNAHFLFLVLEPVELTEETLSGTRTEDGISSRQTRGAGTLHRQARIPR